MEATTIWCDVGCCMDDDATAVDYEDRGDDHGDAATEMHWRLADDSVTCWPCCAGCIEASKIMDEDFQRRSRESVTSIAFLYLPIVQPVIDSEQAIALEVALHAACRLLRICKGDDEAEQTLALLKLAQAEAWERVNGKEAA